MQGNILIGIVVIAAIGFIALGSAWQKAAREEMRSQVAKECIEDGGKYHETWLRRRPVCKVNEKVGQERLH